MTADMGRGMRLSLGLLAGLLLAALDSSSADTPRAADPGSADDVQDVLFFGDSRPVLIRLHIFVDGKPYATRWTEYLTRWFRFLDRDDNGYLLRDELARAPNNQLFQQLLSNPYSYQSTGAAPFEDFDHDRDNKVSLAEFLNYYRQSSAGPVQLSPANASPTGNDTDPLTETLYRLLDTNKDGKLSPAELLAAETVLHKYDQDDDELISVQELSSPTGVAQGPGLVIPAMRVPAPQVTALPLMLVPHEEAPRRVTRRLHVAKDVLARYDKNKNKKLSREEIGMPKECFDQLDADKDGELDSVELLRWLIATPDAEIVLRLGRVENKFDPVDVVGKANPALRKTAGNALTFSNEENRINVMTASSVSYQNIRQVRQNLVQQFKAIDQTERGYVTKKQLHVARFSYLLSILLVADRDGDDCLDRAELDAWLDLLASGVNCQTSVAFATSGRGLFEILDANQDGRLSVRELRNAWGRLAVYDRDKDRGVARTEIPLQFKLVVNSGSPNNSFAQPVGVSQPVTSSVSLRGPLWFRKMDHNGDGDVSAREFLGSRADFRRLDTDGDGLISLDEARRADAALRKK